MAKGRRPKRLPARRRRRGGIYVLVVGVAMIVSVLALAGIAARRIERQMFEATADVAEARRYALAAIEIGRLRIKNDADWRSTFPNGVWEADVPVGSGTYTLEGIDPLDGALGNSSTHPVLLIGTGASSQATQKMQVTLLAEEPPLEALRTCVHCAGQLHIKAGKFLTVSGAPASTNADFRNDGFLNGSVEAATRSGAGVVTGSQTIPAPPKDMPDAGVFDAYKNMATPIPYSGNLDRDLLTPGVNTYGGGLNPNGVYYLNTGGSNLEIRGSRVHGTLVVEAGSAKVTLRDVAFLHNYRPDCPVLIVQGNLEVLLKSTEYDLKEGVWTTNFNPPGAPYEGVTDDDQSDSYPNEVWGLVHVIGTVLIKETARLRGTLICESGVTCEGANEIIHNYDLYRSPPRGYRSPPVMKVAPGSWRQVVD